MPFISAPGIEGQLYVPEETPGSQRKHNCKDCTSCMVCNDDKCSMCLNQKTCDKKGPSTEHSIES